jgi:hypothetical protein
MRISNRHVFTPETDAERVKLLVYLSSPPLAGHELTITENDDGTVTAAYPDVVRPDWPP